MAAMKAKVSFFGADDPAVDAVVSIGDRQLSIEVSGRPIGRWPISDLSPRLSEDSVVVSAEGEQLVIDVTDAEALSVALRLTERPTDPGVESPEPLTPQPDSEIAESRGRHVARSTAPDESDWPSSPAAREASTRESPGGLAEAPLPGVRVSSVRDEIVEREQALAAAEAQLRWIQELVPRRLPIPVREGEAGLGVVQGVRLKERRPLPGADGLQPWVVVDTGNVYVTTMRLIFSGAQDVEFDFDDIDKKGASSTGLLLGVSSRIQSHILEGPGERLAVVLTAAEKIARGVDPTVPFKEAISRLTSEIQDAEGLLESSADAPSTTDPASAVGIRSDPRSGMMDFATRADVQGDIVRD